MVHSYRSGWELVATVTRAALFLAPASFLDDVRANLASEGIQDAIAKGDTARIFDWLMGLIQFQGISDAIASAYADEHGLPRWTDIDAALRREPSCPRLLSHWHFECGYRKAAGTCTEPKHLPRCPLPLHPLRKGGLNQAAYSLFLFIRDVCDGDLVGWIDGRLAAADPGINAPDRAAPMRVALLEPLGHVYGVSDKLWSMMLADLLLGGDPARERWLVTSASMIAIDTLVHNFLHRTGVLRRLGAEHPYGCCYGPGGCAEIIEGLARRIDAREFNPGFPACFPRFVQSAIWRFCAGNGLDICNGNRIDDRGRCRNRYCPAYEGCDRLSLKPGRGDPSRDALSPR